MNGYLFTPNKLGCSCCGANSYEKLFTVNTPYLDQEEEYTLHRCTSCDHVTAEGQADFDFLKKIYGESFFASAQQSIDAPDSPVKLNANARAKSLHGLVSSGRLLDIGSGNGAFISAASKFYCSEGIELSPQAVDNSTKLGLKVYEGDVLSVVLSEESYDIITLWDVLASCHYPDEVMTRCTHLLSKNGILRMTLPMIDSRSAKLFGKRWPMMIPPVNLHYFTEKSIQCLAKRAGLEVVGIEYPGKLVSLQFIIVKALRSLGLYKFEHKVSKLCPSFSLSINLFDISTVTFKKVGSK